MNWNSVPDTNYKVLTSDDIKSDNVLIIYFDNSVSAFHFSHLRRALLQEDRSSLGAGNGECQNSWISQLEELSDVRIN